MTPLHDEGTETDLELGNVSLDQIRQAEAEVARRIAAAQQAAEQILIEAQTRIDEIQHEAEVTSQQHHQEISQKIVVTAQTEAEAILLHARREAEGLYFQGVLNLDLAVDHAIAVIVGHGVSTDKS